MMAHINSTNINKIVPSAINGVDNVNVNAGDVGVTAVGVTAVGVTTYGVTTNGLTIGGTAVGVFGNKFFKNSLKLI